ncbi:FAD binding domain-containing protein [Biscogniauxia marginata]|nr:FAD binding domain-containing protein [Biscogniauxia marginata]
MLAERNLTTTKWPKMDQTNARSMELYRRLGIADGFREVGVPPEYPFDIIISTGFSEGQEILRWKLPSVSEWRETIKKQNDGTQPREPWQRCSQKVFEAWLKPHIQKQDLIKSVFGLKFLSLTETESGVTSELIDASGEKHIVASKYVIGCDGAGSAVRKGLGKTLIGGPVERAMYLCEFKSRDLETLHRQGHFTHVFFVSGHVLVSLDEKDTWTMNAPVPLGTDAKSVDPHEAVSKGLGGVGSPVPIKIDEVPVFSTWRPTICIVNEFSSPYKRVFLAGDAAHQNIPIGGYGLNTAVVDSFDIGWKIAAVLSGYGGPSLLDAYEAERRPVAQRAIERSGVHWGFQDEVWRWVAESGKSVVSEDGAELREKIRRHLTLNDGANKDQGIVYGYRYNNSPIICPDEDGTEEPPYSERSYIPSTWPGARAPQVFLKDGVTSIFDIFGQGREYTLVDFTKDGRFASVFAPAAEKRHIPLKMVRLPDEEHVRKIWERDAVLVRPDDHVAWRASVTGDVDNVHPEKILDVVTGNVEVSAAAREAIKAAVDSLRKTGFTSTIGNVDQDSIENRAVFQSGE